MRHRSIQIPALVVLLTLLATPLQLLWAAPSASSIELSDCRLSAGPGYPRIAARCGRLTRPLDPDDANSESIDLAVAVVPALSLEPAGDPFVPIAGGPGQSTLEFYAGWAQAFERVRLKRDIVLLDQRGTGDSAPMVCDVDDELVEGSYSAEQTLALTKDCLAALPHDPRYFTTSAAVSDLEALRIALGYQQFNVYGISYGSRVAQHFARRYPDATRTIILDGVVPPQLALGPDIATESQRAIDAVIDRCAEEPHCAKRFPALRDDFAGLLRTLGAASQSVAVRQPLSGKSEIIEFSIDHLRAAIRLLLYNPRTVALLPLLIDEAAAGNLVPLASQYQMAAASLTDALSIGMHNAVLCTEDAPFIDWEALDYEALDASYLGPLQLEAIRSMCSVWPAGILDEELRTPLSSDKPVLLLSGNADPITPPAYATMAAVDLDRAWLLTGKNQGHGLAVVGCMPRVVAAFVDAAGLADGDADCLQDAFVMPFFLDFSGPAP